MILQMIPWRSPVRDVCLVSETAGAGKCLRQEQKAGKCGDKKGGKAMRQVLVYQSKDIADYKKAQEILSGQGISCHAWETEEVSQCGCGGKVDIRRFGRKDPIPTRICHIEVNPEDGARAKAALKGKVKPVLSYGYGV